MEIVRPLLVLLASSSLLFFITYIFRFFLYSGHRSAMLQAFVTVGGLVWFGTELLSLFKAITFSGLAVYWGIVYIMTLSIMKRISGGDIKYAILADLREIRQHLISLPRGLFATIVGILLGILILGLIAFAAAPATWDSMTYHLSRVMHWEQNQSLAFYPTSIERQLHLSPLAEMIMLNFQILAGNDHLANFVQYFAMIGCVTGVSFLAQILGGNIFAQVLASLAVMTLPMGILQSTSTQTDYVVALWLVCFVSLMLKYLQAEKPSWFLSFLQGISLGLAISTKITAVLFGVSFGVWLALGSILRFKSRAWRQLIILLFTALLIITPHTFRNFKLYRNPLGPMSESGHEEYKYTNDSYGFSVFASNIVRNTAIHLALPFGDFNNDIEKIILRLHTILKIDVNDPRTTWTGTIFHIRYSMGENLAGNPYHLLLIIISLFLLVYYRSPKLILYVLCIATGFILFSWLLKWQPWHSRLHLSLFVLAMPFVGVVLSNSLRRWMLYGIMSILMLASLSYLFLSPERPLLGANSVLITSRFDQYSSSSYNFDSYREQARVLSQLQCNDIGLMANIDDWEYPLWVMTKAYGKSIHLEHILVDNPSGRLEAEFNPCAIVVTYPFQDQTIIYRNESFSKFSEVDRLSLFVLEER